MKSITPEEVGIRTQELVDSCLGSSPCHRERDITILSLALRLTPSEHGAYMSGLLIAVAYELGRKDARLEMFKSAEIKEEV